jgi:hypothetical protein
VKSLIGDVMESEHKTFVYHLPLPTVDPVYMRYPLETGNGDALRAAHEKYMDILDNPRNRLPEVLQRKLKDKIPGIL